MSSPFDATREAAYIQNLADQTLGQENHWINEEVNEDTPAITLKNEICGLSSDQLNLVGLVLDKNPDANLDPDGSAPGMGLAFAHVLRNGNSDVAAIQFDDGEGRNFLISRNTCAQTTRAFGGHEQSK
jgi:hypothetical protein